MSFLGTLLKLKCFKQHSVQLIELNWKSTFEKYQEMHIYVYVHILVCMYMSRKPTLTKCIANKFYDSCIE